MAYRILSLDGGGSWALIQVRALIELYGKDKPGNEILRDFDMVAANSGGSLVLGGLVENLALSQLLQYFEDESKRKAIFSPSRSFGDRALHELTGLGPKYSSDAKLSALQRLLPRCGDLKLAAVAEGMRRDGAEKDVHLLIIGFDYDRNRATFFRSARAGGPQWGVGDPTTVTVAEAIHASTNAPVNYFDGPASFPDRPERYWDGGVTGCNNPVLAAVTEAIVSGQGPSNIVVLSVGTATVSLPQRPAGAPDSPYWRVATDPGLASDLRKLATAILDDPPDAATFLAHVMTGGSAALAEVDLKSRVVRLNPLISPIKDPKNEWGAPSGMTAAQFKYLVGLDMDAVEQHEVDQIAAFTDLWVHNKAMNQPIRMEADTLTLELGYDRFADAIDAWQKLR
jgi:hypothetical protein